MYIYIERKREIGREIYILAQPIMKKFAADIETVHGILNPVTVSVEAAVCVNDDAMLRKLARKAAKAWRKANGFTVSKRKIRRLMLMTAISNPERAVWTY